MGGPISNAKLPFICFRDDKLDSDLHPLQSLPS